MRFKRIRILKFKGINDTTIELQPAGGNVFTLIGVNESGKTTVLEAISKLQENEENMNILYGEAVSAQQKNMFIPKHSKSNFSETIIISALMKFEDGEKEEILSKIEKDHACIINRDVIPDEIEVGRHYHFEDSEFKRTQNIVNLEIQIKKKGQKKYRKVDANEPEWQKPANKIIDSIPRILYFPTFLFNFPGQILLNPKGNEDPVNALYRGVINDVAAALKPKIDVNKHIIDRILSDKGGSSSAGGLVLSSIDRQQAVEATLEDMGEDISKTVFDAWKVILGKTFDNRRVILKPNVILDDKGEKSVYLQIAIRDGRSTYDLSERSLGFRWFFTFLLFTLYRAMANRRGATLFLFDEPAANLHPKAQTQLLKTFAAIARPSSQIIYSTHSHYMVNPAWLEQSFIVVNSAIDKSEKEDQSGKMSNNSPKISVQKYRNYVGKHPDKITYFQVVLDKLEYAPSLLDASKPCLLVEGKGDYFMLEFVKRQITMGVESTFNIIPTRGATGMDEIIGLMLGWGVPFCICLDGDPEGVAAKKKYIEEWALRSDRVFTLADVDPTLVGATIERLLDQSDIENIKTEFALASEPTKSQKRLFFSEKLAADADLKLSERLSMLVGRIVNKTELALLT